MRELAANRPLRDEVHGRLLQRGEVRLGDRPIHLRGVAHVVAPFWPVAARGKPAGRKHGQGTVRA